MIDCTKICDKCVDLLGWGCRYLDYVPPSMPTTDTEFKYIYNKVFQQAEELGIINCKKFDSSKIMSTLSDTDKMREIVHLGASFPTVLLSHDN